MQSERRARVSLEWVLRQLSVIVLAHLAVLGGVYLLLLIGDVLFTSYAVALQDAVFVRWVAQPGFLQRMADDVKGAVAFVVGLSALFQMLVFLWRAVL